MSYPNNPPVPASINVDTTASINSGLVGFWPLTDGTGTTATDLSTGGNDGTQGGGVTWASTEKGTAASFDGVDDYITANTSTLSQPVTISAWFKTTDNWGYVIDGDDASDRLAIFFYANTLYYFAGGSGKTLGTGYNDGEWHHIAVTFDTVETAYIDGSLVLSASDGSNQLSGITIGARYSLTEYLDGNIQNVRVYDRALSASEVSRLYQDPWAGTNRAIEPSPTAKDLDTSSSLTTDLVGWWPLTEFGPQDTLAYDISVNGNHGVASGGVQRQFTDVVRAATFDGVDDYFDTGSNTIVTSFPITVSAWVSPGAATRDVIFGSYRATGTSRSFQCEINSAGRMEMISSSDGTFQATNKVTGTTTLPSGSFSHVVFVFEGSGGSLYLNGSAESSSGSLFSSLNTPVVDCLIGAEGQSGSTAHHFDGNIQNVRVYSRALSAAEVQTLYDDPWVGLATDSLVYAYYSAAFLQRLG